MRNVITHAAGQPEDRNLRHRAAPLLRRLLQRQIHWRTANRLARIHHAVATYRNLRGHGGQVAWNNHIHLVHSCLSGRWTGEYGRQLTVVQLHHDGNLDSRDQSSGKDLQWSPYRSRIRLTVDRVVFVEDTIGENGRGQIRYGNSERRALVPVDGDLKLR
jgi:hypothetical protein